MDEGVDLDIRLYPRVVNTPREIKVSGPISTRSSIVTAESGATRTSIPVEGGHCNGDCGQQVMAA